MRKKFPVQGMLLGSCLLAGTLMLTSCGSELDEDFPQQEQTEQATQIVKSGTVSLSFGGGLSTRITGDATSGYNWAAGDQIVAVSNGAVCGTLVCSGQNSEGTAGEFTGTLKNFNPSEVRLYFCGNQNVTSTTMSFDFSQQNGSNTSSNARTFFYLDSPIQLKDDGNGNWVPTADVPVMQQLTKQVELKFDEVYSVSEKKISSITISGLKNQVVYDMLTGTMQQVYAEDAQGTEIQTITIAPLTKPEYDNDYILSLPAQTGTPSMFISYIDNATGYTQYETITPTNAWNLEQDATSYKFDAKTSAFTSTYTSSKGGYTGDAVDTHEQQGGQSLKGGYGGSAADGQVENPTGNKVGYGGAPVGI